MPSLTPHDRAEETAEHAFRDGMISGALAFLPSSVCVYAAMKNSTFVKATNYQSRTALVIMPPLLMFGISSESKLNHRMRQMANESDHNRSTAEWAEEHQTRQRSDLRSSMRRMDTDTGRDSSSSAGLSKTSTPADDLSSEEAERQLTDLYHKSVENSGVRIVPGDRLGPHHQFANFWQENPFKILAGIGIPATIYIFKGRNEQQHLQLQSKIMQTRVFAQFTVIGMLLTLMGFKEYMDRNGKYITEYEAYTRVEDMKRMREQLKQRIARDRVRMDERDRVLRGKVDDSKEHKRLALELEHVDDFEKQVERKEKKSKKKKAKKKKVEETSVEEAAIDEKEADEITASH